MATRFPIPPNEFERIQALLNHKILDTKPEAELDAITKLASHICKTPIALISLVDENRQWFKSKIGFDVSETSRDLSFCQYTIMGNEIYEVTDASKNELFLNNPLVSGDPFIKFYAGAPIIDTDGFKLGTLCVIDMKAGKLNLEQKESLKLLAHAIYTHIGLRKNNEEIKKSKIELENFFDLSIDLMCIANSLGYFTKINAAFTKTLGYTVEELLGSPYFELIHPDDIQQTRVEIENLSKGETTIQFKNRFRRKDGVYVWLSWNCSPDPQNGILYATARDITSRKNAELLFQKNEESLNRAQRISKVGSWEFNLETFELTWSKEHYTIFEMEETPPDKLYREYRNKIHPDDLPLLDELIQNSINSGEGLKYEHRVLCKNGCIKYVIGIGEVISDEQGKSKIVRGTVQDITDQKRLEQKLLKSKESLNNAQSISKIGSWEFNLVTNDLTWSNEMYAIFEMSETSADKLFEACRRKVHPDDIEIMDEAIAYATSQGEALNLEHRIICNDGRIKYLLGIGKVNKNEKGDPEWLVGTVQDVTERKKIEKELIKAKELAEEAIITKDNFLANMSHEIRTPMFAIIGFTELMNNTTLNEKQRDYINSLKISGEYLLSVINDILDFSKIESGRLAIENQPFKLTGLLNNLNNMLSVNSAVKNLELNFNLDRDITEFVSGDQLRISQVLINLVGNAIKFTEKGSVTLTVEKMDENENFIKLKFRVKDTGIGIPFEKSKAIFDRFTQADNEIHRSYGGTGLGLSISKNLIELMGGELRLNSELGLGSEFSFEINLGRVNSLEADNRTLLTGAHASIERLTILVFEDNLLNQKLISNVLSNFNIEVEIAENGKTGLEKLKMKSFDLILMDLQMPEIDGYRATAVIRNELKLKTPIIAITAHSLAREKEKCLALGMNDYISKPYKPEELFEKICNLVNQTSEKIENRNRNHLSIMQSKSLAKYEYLRALSNGNRAFEKEMLEIFIDKVPMEMDLMEKAIHQKSFMTVRGLAHSLITSVSIVGIDECLPLLASIQNAAQQYKIAEDELNAFNKLKTIVDDCVHEFESVVSENYLVN